MATDAMKWRTAPIGTEGTTTVYVDSRFGSDLLGEGTRAKPYQSWGKAYRAKSTRPTLIVCRGRFSEMLADGNHACEIRGDYYGAATFDGAGYYLIYGFTHNNLIIVNTCVGTYDLAVHTGSVAFAGVGRAGNASGVGYANYVYGVAGSSVMIDRASHYWGCIGGSSACKYVCVSRPRRNETHRIWIGGNGNDVVLGHSTVYGCVIEDRMKKQSSANYTATCASTIFAEFAMIANDVKVNYTSCLFAADARWYYLTGSHGGTGTVIELPLTGTTSAERQASLLEQLNAKYEEYGVAEASRYIPVFKDCIFSTQTAEEIFNNPSKQDFTLREGSDAIINESVYLGAFPPALNVPILNDSTGVVGSWDELSASGCITVADDTICLDETSTSMSGEILSKIVKINPANYQLNGIFAHCIDKFTDYSVYLNRQTITGTSYSAGEVLPIGVYIVKGAVIYQENNISNNSILVVSENNTTFADDNYTSQLIEVLHPNTMDVVYIRARSTIYAKIKASDGLERGGIYLNIGNKDVTYHGRVYAPGESFVAKYDNETFTCDDSAYEVGIMFDDSRVPTSEWVPARMFGEYFVMKQSGAIRLDNNGVPVSSGNYLAYQTTANGGFSDQLRKSIISQAYVQFAIFVTKYDHIA